MLSGLIAFRIILSCTMLPCLSQFRRYCRDSSECSDFRFCDCSVWEVPTPVYCYGILPHCLDMIEVIVGVTGNIDFQRISDRTDTSSDTIWPHPSICSCLFCGLPSCYNYHQTQCLIICYQVYSILVRAHLIALYCI